MINFLQTRQPPILPILPLLDNDGHAKDDYSSDLQKFHDFGLGNKETLGELLFYFFRHYGHEVAYDTAVISVRRGGTLTKKEKNWHLTTNNRLCVEEPFNTERNLGNTADDTAFRGLHLELRKAFSRIAEAQDVVSSVCEEFEFPLEEPRMFFERPQPHPATILQPSTGQNGRGSRSLYGGRATLGKAQGPSRNGTNNRRASSAASFAHNPHPLLAHTHLILPDQYGNTPQSQRGLHDQLSELSHQLSLEEGRLRYQQLLMTQAQFQAQNYAHQQARGHDGLYASRRAPQSGYTSPGTRSFDQPGAPAAMYQSLPQLAHHDCTGSAQKTPLSTTGPSSPGLSTSTDQRRSFPRTPVQTSGGAAVRSQSQPARPLGPVVLPQVYPSTLYQSMTLPTAHSTRQESQSGYAGPFVTAYGNYVYYPTTADQIPREYLGYGYSGSSHFSPHYADNGSHAMAPYEDLAEDGSAPLLGTNHAEITSPMGSSRSPSPAIVSDLMSLGMRSASLPEAMNLASLQTNPSVHHGTPIVVNGSYRADGLASIADHLKNENNLVKSVSHNTASRKAMETDRSLPPESVPPDATSCVNQDRILYRPRALAATDSTPAVVSRQEHTTNNLFVNGEATHRETPHSIASLSETAESSTRRSSGDLRTNIPALDLSVGHHGSLRQSKTDNAPPSSSTTESASRPPTDGHAGTGIPRPRPWTSTGGLDFAAAARKHDAQASKPPPVPTPVPPPTQSQENRRAYPLGNGSFLPTRAAGTARENTTNAWQPAAKKGGKKVKASDTFDTRTRGEPVPANESERKGG